MTKHRSRSEGYENSSESQSGAPSAQSTMGRDRILELLQAEIDKLNPLDETRRAAALIGESSIRIAEEPATPGFVIVGSDGQPRTSVRDGQPVPFTLEDLANELRKNYPSLFKPATSTAMHASRSEPQVVAAPRDWLLIGSGQSEPRIEADGPALPQADIDERRQSAPNQGPEKAESSNPPPDPRDRIEPLNGDAKSVSILTRIAGVLRPSHALYAVVLISIVTALAFVFSGPGSDSRSSGAPDQQATLGSKTGPASSRAPTPAQQASTSSKPPVNVEGIPDVVDTTTLSVDNRIVRLFGVEWERGAQAEDLTRYIAGRQVVCAPTVRSDRYRCQVAGRDLSEVILYNGGGRATHEATPELKAAEEKARARGIGVWQKP